ncbi:MAG TPA: Pycsar system effector family protein [Pseudonocardiaceae bacterium]
MSRVDSPGAVAARAAAVRDEVRDELRKADSKATTMLTLVGVSLAAVVALTGRSMPLTAGVLVWVSVVPITGAVVSLLSAIRPRLGGVQPGTWLHAAHAGPAAFLTACHADDPRSTSEDVCQLAVIARAKYRRVHRAVVLLLAGLALLGAGLGVLAVSSLIGGAA